MMIDLPRLRGMIATATKHLCKLVGLGDVRVDIEVQTAPRAQVRILVVEEAPGSDLPAPKVVN